MATLPALALLPLAGALGLCLVGPRARRASASIAGSVALAALALVLLSAPAVFQGTVPAWRVEWMPSLGLAFGFRMDGLAWLFALLITGIGVLVVLYAAYYLSPRDPPRRFYLFLLLFMGAMLGIVLADNLLLLVVFWELTSLTSFLLIGYWNADHVARQGARMALAITGAGGLALLGGVLLLGHIAGGFELDRVLAAGDAIRAHPLYVPMLLLVLAGCFTKSAQFPFHFWLPHAMAAPTPVSAYLHSATMVKAGVFLLARLYPALGGTEPWFWIVTLTGLATLLVGAYIAIFKHDLKGLLAYSTISHLGLITMLFGLDTPLAVVAGVFHILNHATFKASLFMAAGIIDHETGSRDMRQLNGLWKPMPRTGALAMVAAAAMAGVPLANGFLSKEMFFAETLVAAQPGGISAGPLVWLLPLGATLAGICSVAYSARFIHDVFFNGEPIGLPKTPHEPPAFMRVPVEILVLVCLAVGLAPAWSVGPVLAAGAQAALHGGPHGELPAYTLKIWHGVNLPLAMSAIALAGGLLLYFGLQRRVNLHRIVRLPLWIERGGRDFYEDTTAWLRRRARGATDALQNGSLQRYLLLLVLMALAAGALPFWTSSLPPTRAGQPANALFVLLWVLGCAAAVGTLLAYRRRLAALVLIGAVGLLVSLLFAYLSAPDLALTQLLVEIATIVLMMLALHWLPQESPPEAARAPQVLHALVAIAAGAGVATLTWAVQQVPLASIAPYFLQQAVPAGGGSNVVNVILVDFRGFDTLGEITVLGIAAIVVFALLAGFAPPRAVAAATSDDGVRHPLVLALVSRLLLPFAVLVSIFLFLRGHNLPGGGFIAALALAIALILLYVANGQAWVTRASGSGGDYRGWVGWGLAIAGLTGVASWWFGAPYLTSSYAYPVLPLVGAVPLASAALFDLGVYLTVVGATMVTLTAIGRLRPPAKS